MADALALFNAADLTMPGHEQAPTELGTFGYGNDPQIDSSSWPTRGADGRFVPQIERFLNYGQPPSSSSTIDLPTQPITWQFQVPELPDGSPSLLMPGMPLFAVTERGPADLDVTVVMSLAKINQYARDQWNDFVTYTSDGLNPHFNYEMREFLTSMRVYGERGLRDYHWAKQNAMHDRVARKLLVEYDGQTNTKILISKWNADKDSGNTEPLTLREYYARATQPGYCYLTQFGFLQRLRFLGIILTVNKGVSLEDCMEEGQHIFTVSVAVGKLVEATNCFGTDDEITIGSRLWIELSRQPCPATTADDPNQPRIPYGCYQLMPRGAKVRDYPRLCDVGYQDESGAFTQGHYWRVGVVLEPPGRAASQSTITQATNCGAFSNPELAYKMNALLPTMRIALGFRN